MPSAVQFLHQNRRDLESELYRVLSDAMRCHRWQWVTAPPTGTATATVLVYLNTSRRLQYYWPEMN
ncbi:hypothetical protein ACLOJK_008642 [Asimina triloba]